jgi:two-component SAPR family response regulator
MGSLKGPIIILEDDEDEKTILIEVMKEMQVENEIKFFTSGVELYDYLLSTNDKPFIIISDINVPRMNGLELKKAINESQTLRRKSIPFVFLSTTSVKKYVEAAYDLTAQGYFVKQNSFKDIERHLRMIFAYWRECRHTNSD